MNVFPLSSPCLSTPFPPHLQVQHAVDDVLQCLGASDATRLRDVAHLEE